MRGIFGKYTDLFSFISLYYYHVLSFLYHYHHYIIIIMFLFISSSSSSHADSIDSLDTLSPSSPYQLSLITGPLDFIHCLYRPNVCEEMYIGRPTLVCPCVGVPRKTLFMSSSFLLQLYPTDLVYFTQMVYEMGNKWPYSCCFVGCCLQNFFKTAHSILMQFSTSFFSKCFIRV